LNNVALLTTFSRLLIKIMSVGENIKRIREQRSIRQQEIADLIGMHRSNYSKIESGQREISITALDKIAAYFDLSIDDIVHLGSDVPEEVRIEDKATSEQLRLIQELDPDDKSMVFKMIDSLLTKKKMKDFFQQQIAH